MINIITKCEIDSFCTCYIVYFKMKPTMRLITHDTEHKKASTSAYFIELQEDVGVHA